MFGIPHNVDYGIGYLVGTLKILLLYSGKDMSAMVHFSTSSEE